MLKVKKLDPSAIIPTRQSPGCAGYDLHALVDVVLHPNHGPYLISTGIAVELPPQYELQIRPRSGLSAKTDLRVILGTVDEDFRGELRVIAELKGGATKPYTIRKGDRIAQAIISPVVHPTVVEVDELSTSDRKGGFGSTGL